MTTKNGLPPIHPGAFLKEILGEIGISQNAFAHAIGVSPMRISHVIKGTRPVTAELALLFGKIFTQTPTYWMNLQTSYDLKITEQVLMEKMRQVQPLSRAG
jgi:antitoxin HigA-1